MNYNRAKTYVTFYLRCGQVDAAVEPDFVLCAKG